jgi:hypothetical protein
MKLLKLFPVAMAVFALASCSTDEIESNQPVEQNVATKGDLRINFDPIEGEVVTRAFADKNFNGPMFEAGDKIYVYDEKMHSTDVYAFDDAADKMAFYFDPQFEGDTKLITGIGSDVPAYGVFAGQVTKNPKGWVKRDEKGTPTCVDITIPHVLTYKQDGTMYGFDMPAFGQASYNNGDANSYIQLDHFRFLTALLRIRLDNAFSNATFLKITNGAGKPLSGLLTAKLYKNEDETAEDFYKNSQLGIVDEDYDVYPELYIDLSKVPSTRSYIYIPIVAGLDGDTDDIELWYTGERTHTAETIVEDDLLGGVTWTAIGMKFPGVEFQVNHAYAGSYAFELADMSPKKVSDLLDNYKASGSDVKINITRSFTINPADPDVDNVIYLPKFDNDVNVEITLADAFVEDNDPATEEGWNFIGGGTKRLQIMDADPENPFEGTITINTADKCKTLTANKAAVRVELVAGTAVLAGSFDNAQIVNPVSGNIKIGDGTTVTTNRTLYTTGIGDGVLSLEIADKAETNWDIDCTSPDNLTSSVVINGKNTGYIAGGELTATITVGETGEQTGDITTLAGTDKDLPATITVNGKLLGNIAGSLDAFWTNVNVAGYVQGYIDTKYAVKGKITLTTECADPTEVVVTGNVWTKGDVDIKLAAEGEAISGQLAMSGSKKTINLVQGYVQTIYVNVENAGQWEDKFINITLNDPAAGLTAFKKLITYGDNHVKYTESKWNGKFIAATSSYKGAKTYYENAKAAEKELKQFDEGEDGVVVKKLGGNTSLAVFTAAQFASLTEVNQVRLLNDIDLNNQEEWVGLPFAGDSFWAFNHTISNVSLKNALGLFRSSTGDGEIFDLQLVNPAGDVHTKDGGKSGVAALMGFNSKTLSIKNVKVTGLSITDAGHKTDGSKVLTSVAGLVGYNYGALTLEKDEVAGSITGFYGLGGLVGIAEKKPVTIKECTAAITIAPDLYEGNTMNINYAKFGGFIGTATSSAPITIDAETGCTLTQSVPAAVTAKMYISDTTAGVGSFYNYKRKKDFIGYCGAGTLQNPTTVGAITIGTGNGVVGGLFASTTDAEASANYSKFISYMLKK